MKYKRKIEEATVDASPSTYLVKSSKGNKTTYAFVDAGVFEHDYVPVEPFDPTKFTNFSNAPDEERGWYDLTWGEREDRIRGIIREEIRKLIFWPPGR